MKTIERLSEVVGKVYLCEGASIPLREGFFHSSKELGVFMDELDASLPENPYSVFRGMFKKVKTSADRILAKHNQAQMELRKEKLAVMLAVFDSIPELHNDSGKRWHVYNPPFLPLDIFVVLMITVSKQFNKLGLSDAPEIRRMQEQTGIVPLVWFEAWRKCFEAKLDFVENSHVDDKDIEWHREFIDFRLGDNLAKEQKQEQPVVEPVSSTIEVPPGEIKTVEPDSVTEMMLGKRCHNPVTCNATLEFTMEFNQSSSILQSIIDASSIRNIDLLDDVKVVGDNKVEVTLLTTICDSFPAAENIQVSKLKRLAGVVDKVYECIYEVLEEIEKQREVLAPLLGAYRVEDAKEADDYNLH